MLIQESWELFGEAERHRGPEHGLDSAFGGASDWPPAATGRLSLWDAGERTNGRMGWGGCGLGSSVSLGGETEVGGRFWMGPWRGSIMGLWVLAELGY